MSANDRPAVLVSCPVESNAFAGWLIQTLGLKARNEGQIDFSFVFLSSKQERTPQVIRWIRHTVNVWIRARRMPELRAVYFPIFFLPNVMAAVIFWLTRTPYVCRVSGSELTPGNPLTFRLRIALLRRATAIICLNLDSVRILSELGVSHDRLHYLSNPVDVSRFRPATRMERLSAQTALNIKPSSKLVVGTVGTVCARKGTLELIQAVDQMRHEGLALRICGPVSDTPEIDRAYVAECKRHAKTAMADVALLGCWSDVPNFLAALDVFVLPSHSEGMPNCLLEAMAAGLPVIASDIPGISDIITCPDTGLLVPPGDVPALVEALKRIAKESDLGPQLGLAARSAVKTTFATDVIDAGYCAVLSNPHRRADSAKEHNMRSHTGFPQ